MSETLKDRLDRERWERHMRLQATLAAEWWAAHPIPETLPLRHASGGRLLSDDEDPIPS